MVDALHAVGREIAFVPSWFARIESRNQEFSGVVQGDFHVSEFSSTVLCYHALFSTHYFDLSDNLYLVEWWVAGGQQRYQLGYGQLSSPIQSRATLHGIGLSLVLHGTFLLSYYALY